MYCSLENALFDVHDHGNNYCSAKNVGNCFHNTVRGYIKYDRAIDLALHTVPRASHAPNSPDAL
jgi:hypothetical protein